MHQYPHVLAFALANPWALEPEMGATVLGVLVHRILAGKPSDAELHAALSGKKKERLPQPKVGGGIGVLPVHGVIMPRANMMTDVSGAVAFDTLSRQLRALVNDPQVETILLDIDSPGGNVSGLTEFINEGMLPARATKPVVGVANHQATSAAYAILAACTKAFASPSATVGSVGVYAMHEEVSELLQKEGRKRTYIARPADKVLGNEVEPLSDRALELMHERVSAAYVTLTDDIGRGRGISGGDVRDGYGQGRVVTAAEALKLKMIDRIASMESTLARFTKSPEAASLAAEAFLDEDDDTPQEPAEMAATGQDRVFPRDWQTAIDCELLGW